MTNANKMYRVKNKNAESDACYLYSSAMYRYQSLMIHMVLELA